MTKNVTLDEVRKLILPDSIKTVTVGRFTIVTVETAEGKKGHGVSRCSGSEEYSDRIGYQVALGRAIKSLENKLNGKHNREWYLG